MERLISLVGLFAMVGFAWLLSSHKRRVSWRVVDGGMALQFILGLLILRTDWGRYAFESAGNIFNSSFRAGAFFAALLAGGTTFFTCPSALANRTMSGFADLVAAGVIGVVSSGKEATGTCLDTALVAVFYESGGVANQETVNTSFFQKVFSSK